MKNLTGFNPIILLIIFSVSCSKKEVDQTIPSPGIQIQVVEYKTNIPIQGALVEYYTPCPACCCQPAYNLVLSKHTDGSGNCEIPETIFNNAQYGILITPPPPPQSPIDYYYWPTGSAGIHSTNTKYSLPVTGDEKLHMIKINDFPKGYYMELKAQGEQSSFQVIDIARVYGFPSDTIFHFYTYKGQTNTITWIIYDSTDASISSGGPLTVDFPKTGTNELELSY
jgi:hypothetical protein